MKIKVNDVSLYVDVDGSNLVADGTEMRERSTVVLVHGGPGSDHTNFKPYMDYLPGLAQTIYYDHRGMGRSDASVPERWTLAQWADDLASLLDTLGLEAPYIVGASFGGMVAQTFAARHPERASKLALLCTAPRFDIEFSVEVFKKRGGAECGEAARKFLNGDPGSRDDYLRLCMPVYAVKSESLAKFVESAGRAVNRPETLEHFFGPEGESKIMDLRSGLARVQCPTLIAHGDSDPILPIELAYEMRDAMPKGLVEFATIENCGHIFDDNLNGWRQALISLLFGTGQSPQPF